MQVFRQFLVAICILTPLAWANGEIRHVMIGSTLETGFDMGVNSSENRVGWVTSMGGHFRLAYPSGQAWGALFVTIGKPKDRPRPFMDFSSYKTLKLEMRGQDGGEVVFIGVKTNTQPDDGTETKLPIRLSKIWQTYRFELDSFRRADPTRLYVVTEVVFDGASAKTVMLRNVSFTGSL